MNHSRQRIMAINNPHPRAAPSDFGVVYGPSTVVYGPSTVVYLVKLKLWMFIDPLVLVRFFHHALFSQQLNF